MPTVSAVGIPWVEKARQNGIPVGGVRFVIADNSVEIVIHNHFPITGHLSL
jgi:hypothetical protein